MSVILFVECSVNVGSSVCRKANWVDCNIFSQIDWISKRKHNERPDKQTNNKNSQVSLTTRGREWMDSNKYLLPSPSNPFLFCCFFFLFIFFSIVVKFLNYLNVVISVLQESEKKYIYIDAQKESLFTLLNVLTLFCLQHIY